MTPTRLGPYRLLSPIATRALTVTYRAEHELLRRPALVKALKPAVSVSSPFAQELEREARILTRIRHDAVPEVLDFHRTSETMWMAIEDPGGHRLDEVMRRAPRLDPCAAAAIAFELARGLGHAHEHGIVHRGLRPGFVELTAAGRVVIVDFAAAHDERTPSIPEPFEVGALEKAMDYMAPEQIVGEDGGPPADVFAIGVVLFELIAGAHPFAAPSGGSSDRRELAQRIRSAPASQLHDAVPEVSRALERVVSRALAKNPVDRYPHGRALAAALEDAIAQQTHVPTRVLVSRALAQAKLAEEIRAPGTAPVRPVRARGPMSGVLVAFLAIFALIVAGGLVIEIGLRDGSSDAESGARSAPGQSAGRGYLRVLARPWAEILIDGESVDTTPIGRSIPLAAGKHYVTFKHPNAPEEKRSIKLGAGQTVLLDVTMRIDRPPIADGGPSADAAPPTP